MKALHYAAIVFVIGIVAAVFGTGGMVAYATEVAKILFLLSLIVAAVMLVLGFIGGREDSTD